MGNLDTPEGRGALPFIKSMIPWTERIYDMNEQQVQEYKEAYYKEYNESEEQHEREVVDIFYMEYQYYQVRKTYDWVLEQFKLSGDKMAIRREILMQRLRGSNKSPISPEDLDFLISNMHKAKKEILILNKWLFKLYDHGQGLVNGMPRDLDERIPYIVGIDPSSGGSGDYFAMTIINPYNLQIAAEFRSKYISGPNACKMLVELVEHYIPKAVLVIEKNNMGITILQFALETSIRNNFYWSDSANQVDSISEEDPEDYELKSAAMQYKKYGHWTGKKNRDHMFELLFQHVDECKEILNTEYLVEDLCKLIKTTTGKYQADKGEHDDSLMSYLIAIFCYYTGDNLETFGIIKKEHPLFGKIEDKPEDGIPNIIDDRGQLVLDKGPTTYNELVMRDAAMQEERIKEMTSRLSFVSDAVYSKQQVDPNLNPFDDSVNISPAFFDDLNGISGDIW